MRKKKGGIPLFRHSGEAESFFINVGFFGGLISLICIGLYHENPEMWPPGVNFWTSCLVCSCASFGITLLISNHDCQKHYYDKPMPLKQNQFRAGLLMGVTAVLTIAAGLVLITGSWGVGIVTVGAATFVGAVHHILRSGYFDE